MILIIDYYYLLSLEPTFNNLVVNNTDSNAVTISCTDSGYIALEDCNVTFTTSCGSDRVEVQCCKFKLIVQLYTGIILLLLS